MARILQAALILAMMAAFISSDEASIPSCYASHEATYEVAGTGVLRLEGSTSWSALEACQPRNDGVSGIWADVVQKSPNKPRGWINLGLDYRKLGQFDKAVESFQHAEVAAMRPGADPHQAQLARIYAAMNITDIFMHTGREEEAHQILKSAWLEDPGFPGYAVNLSLFYIEEQQFEKAVWITTEGIGKLRDYPWFLYKGQLYLNRGEAYRLLGRCPEAETDYKLAREDHDIFKIQIPACVSAVPSPATNN